MEPTSADDDVRESARLIAVAIEAEKKAAWFYRTMAEMTSDASAKNTLDGLSNDETSHAETLTRLFVEMTGHGVASPPNASVEGWPDPFDFPSTSRRAALEFALKNEIRAAKLYESQADACAEPRRVEIFRRLAETERRHAAHLRHELG
jgi:rubrerythrin